MLFRSLLKVKHNTLDFRSISQNLKNIPGCWSDHDCLAGEILRSTKCKFIVSFWHLIGRKIIFAINVKLGAHVFCIKSLTLPPLSPLQFVIIISSYCWTLNTLKAVRMMMLVSSQLSQHWWRVMITILMSLMCSPVKQEQGVVASSAEE